MHLYFGHLYFGHFTPAGPTLCICSSPTCGAHSRHQALEGPQDGPHSLSRFSELHWCISLAHAAGYLLGVHVLFYYYLVVQARREEAARLRRAEEDRVAQALRTSQSQVRVRTSQTQALRTSQSQVRGTAYKPEPGESSPEGAHTRVCLCYYVCAFICLCVGVCSCISMAMHYGSTHC